MNEDYGSECINVKTKDGDQGYIFLKDLPLVLDFRGKIYVIRLTENQKLIMT